jgi:YhgE/Pip-like protein
MRVRDVLAVRSVWLPPVILVAVLVFAMTLVYFGSVVDPVGHLHGLPVAVVNEDAGASVGSRRVELGRQIAAGLAGSPAVTDRLALRATSLADAQARMDRGREYATVVIPRGFTASLVALAGGPMSPGEPLAKPEVQLLTNPRAGTLGVSLATGVLAPALGEASSRIGASLAAHSPGASSPLLKALLRDPITVTVVPYRPLPRHTALGLSAFYISLLTVFCGFLGATVVNVAIDAVLGYAPTEVGPVWRQRPPVAISRWRTLLAKWALAAPVSLLLTGVMLGAAVLVLNMDDPHFWTLWLLSFFAATVVAIGTLVLFAALGTPGQLVALLIFVYLALASSGGTVPLTALSGFFRFFGSFEPLRQILDGVRAILYFGARGDAGLTRAFVATALGLVFWLVLGAAVTLFYDRRKLDRMPPDGAAVSSEAR